MDIELEVNFKEKLSFISSELISSFGSNLEAMLRRNSAEGLLRSGRTVNGAKELLSQASKEFYSDALSYLHKLDLEYSSSLVTDIDKIVDDVWKGIEPVLLSKFQQSTNVAGKPELYEKLLPEVKSVLFNNNAVFLNQLNFKFLKLKKTEHKRVKKEDFGF